MLGALAMISIVAADVPEASMQHLITGALTTRGAYSVPAIVSPVIRSIY
jgi:hypothetical protein